jgi:hypothetical protein
VQREKADPSPPSALSDRDRGKKNMRAAGFGMTRDLFSALRIGDGHGMQCPYALELTDVLFQVAVCAAKEFSSNDAP